jgi:hypothetical protein
MIRRPTQVFNVWKPLRAAELCLHPVFAIETMAAFGWQVCFRLSLSAPLCASTLHPALCVSLGRPLRSLVLASRVASLSVRLLRGVLQISAFVAARVHHITIHHADRHASR